MLEIDDALAGAEPRRLRNGGRGSQPKRPFLGIDGEGVNDTAPTIASYGGEPTTFHHQRYTLMVANNATGTRPVTLSTWDNEITTERALRFVLSLPKTSILVGYALSYDYTKMLKDVPRTLLDQLYHPDWPEDRPAPKMVWWRGWGLRLVNGKLDLVRGKDYRTVWDVSRFFQSSFATALAQWVPEAAEELAFVQSMKSQRGDFNTVDPDEITRYALTECRYLAVMMTRLRQACADADIPLASYYGAGSVAGGLIRRHETHKYRGSEPNPDCQRAIADAYVGGRFESSIHGPCRAAIHETDISSAYPAAYLDLPCLRCGRWARGTGTEPALHRVRWEVDGGRWGPFPMRAPTLAYPLAGEAWIWSVELAAAQRAFPDGRFETIDAWCYEPRCHHHPHDWVHDAFAQRLEWSREQRGVVLKLGLNAIYGKYAQRVGGKDGAYTSLAWAGLITAQTRARLLATLLLPNADSIVAFATDAVLSLRDLGVGEDRKTLGGWERKPTMEQGALFVANGLVIPFDRSTTRSRGYQPAVVKNALPAFLDAWGRDGIDARVALTSQRFVNAKAALQMTDSSLYGEWIDDVAVQTFDPTPARAQPFTDGDVGGAVFSRPMAIGQPVGFKGCPPIERSRDSFKPATVRRALKRYREGVRKEPVPDAWLRAMGVSDT